MEKSKSYWWIFYPIKLHGSDDNRTTLLRFWQNSEKIGTSINRASFNL